MALRSPFYAGLAVALFTVLIVGMKLGETPAVHAAIGLALPVVLLGHSETSPRGARFTFVTLVLALVAYVAVIVA